ncbi:uncharacterized protein LOC125237743 [Leguminivora glycinivorella]|uniref:uncharacterized protein LOC125237743 n=1 Tax=Leguminivora glycinivorella TaxID=1035111 RepID=UPI00200ECF88|nr:uncharacterized protein LOC125237743 [Leguminivora glycinivorella]
MDEIKVLLEKIQQDLHEQKTDMKNMESRIISDINTNIDQKLSSHVKRISDIEVMVDEQQRKFEFMERKQRERNILLFGMPEQEKYYTELEKLVLDFINEKLEVSCDKSEIENVSRVGRRNDTTRPIRITLTTMGKKLAILKVKNKQEIAPIYLKEDFTPKVLQKRKELQEQAKQEWQAGKQVFIKQDKLIVKEKNKKRNLSISPKENEAGRHYNNPCIQANKKNKITPRDTNSTTNIKNFFSKNTSQQSNKNSTQEHDPIQ